MRQRPSGPRSVRGRVVPWPTLRARCHAAIRESEALRRQLEASITLLRSAIEEHRTGAAAFQSRSLAALETARAQTAIARSPSR